MSCTRIDFATPKANIGEFIQSHPKTWLRQTGGLPSPMCDLDHIQSCADCLQSIGTPCGGWVEAFIPPNIPVIHARPLPRHPGLGFVYPRLGRQSTSQSSFLVHYLVRCAHCQLRADATDLACLGQQLTFHASHCSASPEVAYEFQPDGFGVEIETSNGESIKRSKTGQSNAPRKEMPVACITEGLVS